MKKNINLLTLSKNELGKLMGGDEDDKKKYCSCSCGAVFGPGDEGDEPGAQENGSADMRNKGKTWFVLE